MLLVVLVVVIVEEAGLAALPWCGPYDLSKPAVGKEVSSPVSLLAVRARGV